MTLEICPLLAELPWLKHGFYGHDHTLAITRNLIGPHFFNDIFPDACFYKQTHSDVVAMDDHDIENPADAAVTTQIGRTLAMKTADCCPVLFACTKTRQIAAVHAGWRGALNGITSKTIARMIQNGAMPEAIIAAIGPNISQAHYPVQSDVINSFKSMPQAFDYFKSFEDRWLLDVAGIIAAQITDAGISQLWQSRIDTYTNKNFASYRHYHYEPGLPDTRNVSIIVRKA